jgi:hypothetical protein
MPNRDSVMGCLNLAALSKPNDVHLPAELLQSMALLQITLSSPLRLPATTGVGRVESTRQAIRYRSTSKAEDEVICIAVMMDLLRVSDDHQRLKDLYRLLGEIYKLRFLFFLRNADWPKIFIG